MTSESRPGWRSEPDWRYTGAPSRSNIKEGCGNEESLPYMILSAPDRDAATAGWRAFEKLAFS